jgi:DNA-binding HxlR family transcriptional regulator
MQAVGFHSLVMPFSLDNLVSSCNHFRKVMRHRFGAENCSVAQALEVLGDWWTLLVVREAFVGTRRFADFEASLGISKNILTDRLGRLVDAGVLERVDAGRHGTRFEYQLTAKGKDLAAVMTALRQWGDRWVFGAGNEPLLVLDRRTGRPIPPLRIVGEDGVPLRAADIEVRPGPGASAATQARIRRGAQVSSRRSRRAAAQPRGVPSP